MGKLELIICEDKLQSKDYRSMGRDIRSFVSEVMESLGIDYNLDTQLEDFLKNEKNIPKNAIVYIHGNYLKHYPSVSIARELAEKRPDLKLIVGVDSGYRQSDFDDIRDYQFIKETDEKGFDASHQVVVSKAVTYVFFWGESGEIDPKYTFKAYMTQLKKLRGR